MVQIEDPEKPGSRDVFTCRYQFGVGSYRVGGSDEAKEAGYEVDQNPTSFAVESYDL